MSTNKTASKKATPAKTVKTAPKVKVAPKAETAQAETAQAETAQAEMAQAETAQAEMAQAETTQVEAPQAEETQKPTQDKEMKSEQPTSERYVAACRAVSATNRAFTESLKAKCQILGTSLKGESVGIRDASPELVALSEQIKAARQTLDGLLQQRREFMNVSPELETLNLKIAGLRKQRSLARAEKKAAAAELGL